MPGAQQQRAKAADYWIAERPPEEGVRIWPEFGVNGEARPAISESAIHCAVATSPAYTQRFAKQKRRRSTSA
jgi:hypothetical protein